MERDLQAEHLRRAVEHLSLAQGLLNAAGAQVVANEARWVMDRAIEVWQYTLQEDAA